VRERSSSSGAVEMNIHDDGDDDDDGSWRVCVFCVQKAPSTTHTVEQRIVTIQPADEEDGIFVSRVLTRVINKPNRLKRRRF